VQKGRNKSVFLWKRKGSREEGLVWPLRARVKGWNERSRRDCDCESETKHTFFCLFVLSLSHFLLGEPTDLVKETPALLLEKTENGKGRTESREGERDGQRDRESECECPFSPFFSELEKKAKSK
jgi:hypothetical protein